MRGPYTWNHIDHPAQMSCPGFRIADADDYQIAVTPTEESANLVARALNADWAASIINPARCTASNPTLLSDVTNPPVCRHCGSTAKEVHEDHNEFCGDCAAKWEPA